MPSSRSRRPRAWAPQLDPYRRVALLLGPERVVFTGSAFYYRAGARTASGAEHAEARAAMAKDWAVHGERLTAWWVAAAPEPVGHPWEHVTPGGPGTRPWGWWEFNAAGVRRNGEGEAAALARLAVLGAEEKARMRWGRK